MMIELFYYTLACFIDRQSALAFGGTLKYLFTSLVISAELISGALTRALLSAIIGGFTMFCNTIEVVQIRWNPRSQTEITTTSTTSFLE